MYTYDIIKFNQNGLEVEVESTQSSWSYHHNVGESYITNGALNVYSFYLDPGGQG